VARGSEADDATMAAEMVRAVVSAAGGNASMRRVGIRNVSVRSVPSAFPAGLRLRAISTA
jgi:hypothetical protein